MLYKIGHWVVERPVVWHAIKKDISCLQNDMSCQQKDMSCLPTRRIFSEKLARSCLLKEPYLTYKLREVMIQEFTLFKSKSWPT